MSHQIESRSNFGRTEFKCHRVNGESAWIDSVSARQAVKDHPGEWALTPFSADEQRRAQRDMPINLEQVAR